MRRAGLGQTRWPNPSSGRSRADSGHERWRTASGGCGIAARADAASGAKPETSPAADGAGSARRTRSASRRSLPHGHSPAPAGPRSDRRHGGAGTKRRAERGRERSRQRLETVAEGQEPAGRLSGARPPSAVGPPGRRARGCRGRAPTGRAGGRRPPTESRLADPANTPATKGSTSRSAASGPRRRRTKSATLSSSAEAGRRKGSVRRRHLPEAESRRERRSAIGPIGRGWSSPPKSTYRGARASAKSASPERPSVATRFQSGTSRAHGVRAELEQEAVPAFGPDDAARPVRRFEHQDVAAAPRQGPCRGEAGEARADDDRPAGHGLQNASDEPTRSASARTKVGREFRPGCPAEVRDARRARLAGEELIDLLQRLDVIGHESDRHDEDLPGARAGRARRGPRRSRARAIRRARAWTDTPASHGPVHARRARIAAIAGLDFGRVRVALPASRASSGSSAPKRRAGRLPAGDRESGRAPRGCPRRAPRRTADGSERSRARRAGRRGAERRTAARARSSAPFVVVREYCG